MFTPDWIEEILDFYVPTPSDGETRSDLNMQRDMILTLLYVTPQGVSITNDMLKHPRQGQDRAKRARQHGPGRRLR